MSISCGEIIKHIEELAPKNLAESWDNVGLLVGDPNQKAKKILVALDTTLDIINEAIENKADMIVAHHPIIFKPLKSITKNTAQGEILYKVIQNNISVYCAHTNLDTATGGLNDFLAQKVSLKEVKVLDPTIEDLYKKIVVFVPKGKEEIILEAMAKEGAGWIGKYSECSFMTSGYGTYRPLEGTHPYIGEVGKLEKTPEVRIETICLASKLKKVVQAMLKVHPYEEVAYDVIPIEIGGDSYGMGRIGVLEKEISLMDYIKKIKESLQLDFVKVLGDLNKKIKKVAICSGSGAQYIKKAHEKGADMLLTGDLKYHDAQEAEHLGLAVIDAGHFGTEYIVAELLYQHLEILKQKTKKDFDVIVSKANKELFSFL